uniref:SWIM-type domain-containing protein n=1 Tax=Romanomermis culicivorax TaxID=13658 RepID=A0A915HRA2_ROMCU
MSSIADDNKNEPYNNTKLCTKVIDRALNSNKIPIIHQQISAWMSIPYLSDMDQNMVVNDELKQTEFSLFINDLFKTYNEIREVENKIMQQCFSRSYSTLSCYNATSCTCRCTTFRNGIVCYHSKRNSKTAHEKKSEDIEIDLTCEQKWVMQRNV